MGYGGIMNCDDVVYPADGVFKSSWKYTTGDTWEYDTTITLECNGNLYITIPQLGACNIYL